ncbi:MAG: cysteine desulfurase [Candidatus Harrisonbacteria bacterium]|nr:cysteine desulfurase [Candidatus Harrisonbacteria bacterium]
MPRCYFDYAASTPVDPEVEKAMKPYWSKVFGNPGALHWFGQEASAAVFKARDTIAKSLGCNYREIIFTGSASEANNLALRGVIKGLGFSVKGLVKNKNFKNLTPNPSTPYPKIIVSSIEHESILNTCRDLESEGVEVVYLPVSKSGIVDLKKLEAALDERTVLVSVMYANNEIGAIQPIAEIAKIISDFKKGLGFRVKGLENQNKKNNLYPNPYTLYPFLHTDAVQAFNYLNCNVNDLGVDLMTLSAQKIYGPKGVGALYVRQGLGSRVQGLVKNKNFKNLTPNPSTLYPIITGGSQEYGLRAGTENVPGIVGFGKAIEIADRLREKENRRLRKLQDYFITQVKKKVPRAQLNGDLKNRLPNNINMYIPGVSGQDLIIRLDLAGFAVSPGSACAARVCKPSQVLKALGYSNERAANSIRITFGRQTKKNEIDKLLKALYILT